MKMSQSFKMNIEKKSVLVKKIFLLNLQIPHSEINKSLITQQSGQRMNFWNFLVILKVNNNIALVDYT